MSPVRTHTFPDCARCGHPADWHRLDDSLNLDPTEPGTPFRCIGYDCMRPRQAHGDCDCPDYVAPLDRGQEPDA